MATTTFIPIEEYLHTSYHPDVDYVDGELQERNLGEQWHSVVQKTISALFYMHRKDWGLRSLTEQRVQVHATRSQTFVSSPPQILSFRFCTNRRCFALRSFRQKTDSSAP